MENEYFKHISKQEIYNKAIDFINSIDFEIFDINYFNTEFIDNDVFYCVLIWNKEKSIFKEIEYCLKKFDIYYRSKNRDMFFIKNTNSIKIKIEYPLMKI